MTINADTAQAFALESLSQMVAECELFQDEAHVTSAEDALAFVHWPEYFLPNQQVDRPFAVIFEKSYTEEELADGTTMPHGEVFLQIGKTIENFRDAKDEETKFANFAGSIKQRVMELSRDGTGRLHITLITSNVAARRSNPEYESALGAQKPFYFAEYTVTWNPIG